jgi:murein DD-endopeptidase MepM/ murein hydrolase activator NlpD
VKSAGILAGGWFLTTLMGFWLLALSGCSPPLAIVEGRQIADLRVSAPEEPSATPPPLNMVSPTTSDDPTSQATSPPTLTWTPVPTEPVQQPAMATSVPTVTPTASPTMKPSPTAEPDRTCPETSPIKPEYDRFFLSAKQWPRPDTDVAQTHFWLSKPLPGAGRTLINQRFPYGWDENGRLLLHNGVDIAEDMGTPVLAVADGTVIVAQSDMNAWYGWRCDWYGHLVVLELDEFWQGEPIYALYGHVLNITVEVGQRVKLGDQVAEVGFGGAATHPHLHFEVRVGENEFAATRNPMLWLDPGPTRGVIAGRLVDPEGRPWQGVPLALVSRNGDRDRYSTWSYLGDPQGISNPDIGWAENFVLSDVKPGDYDIYTRIQGIDYRQQVTVSQGKVTAVEIETEPLKQQTPELEVTSESAVIKEGG